MTLMVGIQTFIYYQYKLACVKELEPYQMLILSFLVTNLTLGLELCRMVFERYASLCVYKGHDFLDIFSGTF